MLLSPPKTFRKLLSVHGYYKIGTLRNDLLFSQHLSPIRVKRSQPKDLDRVDSMWCDMIHQSPYNGSHVPLE